MSDRVWLAIDTAHETASVAIGVPPATLAATLVRGARQHAAQVIELVDRCLTADGAGRTARDLAGIVVGDGPGSFTGLRIGWAAAKGLMPDGDLPLVAVPSLLAAAASATLALGGGGEPIPVAACYDALRGQVYGAIYVVHRDRVETLVAPDVLTIARLAERAPQRPRVAVGDGAVRFAPEITRWIGSAPLALDTLSPTASALLSLVHRAGAARPLSDPATAEPNYGRPAEAQAKWEARHGRPLPDSPGSIR